MDMTRDYMQTVTNWKGMMREGRFGQHHYEEE